MRHLRLRKVFGGKLTISSKLRGLRHLAGGSLVQPALHTLKIHDGEYKDVKEFKKVSKPLKFRL